MSDIAESFGVNFGVDLLLAAYTNDDLKRLNQVAFTQLKNRYRDFSLNNKFCVGFDPAYMRYYNVEQFAEEIDIPVIDNSRVGDRLKAEKKKSKFEFSDFK
jgi:hypothetical protein